MPHRGIRTLAAHPPCLLHSRRNTPNTQQSQQDTESTQALSPTMPFLSSAKQGEPGSAQKQGQKGTEHSDASNFFLNKTSDDAAGGEETPADEPASPSKKSKRGEAKVSATTETAPRRASARQASKATEVELAPPAAARGRSGIASASASTTRKQKGPKADVQDSNDVDAPAGDDVEMSAKQDEELGEAPTESYIAARAEATDDFQSTIQPPLSQLAKQLRKQRVGGNKRKRKGGRKTSEGAASASDDSDADPDAVVDNGVDDDDEEMEEKKVKTKAPRKRGPAKPRVDADGYPLKRAKRTQNGKPMRVISRKGEGKQRPLVKQDGTPAVVDTPKHKKVEAKCYECNEVQTSNFRPIVSDYVGKKSKAVDQIPRVVVCNRCYCKMAPRPEYLNWRLGLLRTQVEIFAQHGIQYFLCVRFDMESQKDLEATLEFIEYVRDALRAGEEIGGLKVKPVLPNVSHNNTPRRHHSPDMQQAAMMHHHQQQQQQHHHQQHQQQHHHQLHHLQQQQQIHPELQHGLHNLQQMANQPHMPQLMGGMTESDAEMALRQMQHGGHIPVPEPILEM
ncbi:hypothetical protein BCR37DRAFT_404909 [Protomyces lactucae-debilis]|uniref:Uncharacterized protein n=1 Tax=Protomyces lactucae-debilis TaxID=2754530 RepID=A0A1Y2F9A2_PROLT|nr:uncharacterized protein BCR37DRAFT_404909 [Protomyces lactucae-debilis]ORY80453.1 hypothetical protein BCR37DRAFT_404909 [Protomyces lactucae-debilis]